MKKYAISVVVCAASLMGSAAVAADFDGSENLMCSLGQIVECDHGSECRTVTNSSVDAPDFIKVDFKRKRIVATTAGVDGPPDDIDNVKKLENNVLVQGTQGGEGGARDALGWSMSISHETGQMVLTGSGENAGFVVFGACTPT